MYCFSAPETFEPSLLSEPPIELLIATKLFEDQAIEVSFLRIVTM